MIVAVMSNLGLLCHISEADLANPRLIQIPLRTPAGIMFDVLHEDHPQLAFYQEYGRLRSYTIARPNILQIHRRAP